MIFSEKGSTNDSYTLELSVWEVANSVDIATNTSKVGWQLTLYSTGYNFSYHTLKWKIQIDGETLRDKTEEDGGYLYPAALNKNSYLVLDSGQLTIPHNSDGTKSVYSYVDFESTAGSYMPGPIQLDGTLPLTNIPRYATSVQSLNSKTINSIKMNWSSDSTIDYIWYSKDNGSSWVGIDIADGKSGTYTISGLSPNTTYKIKTRVRRKDSQLTTDSSVLSVTTYDIAKISSASNFNLGSNASITITNPANATATLVMKIGTTQILSKILSTGANTISFTDTQLDNIYKKFGTSNSISISYTLTTNNNSNWISSKNATCTLTGNQKTGHINVNNSWKRTKKWINVENVWKRCVRWVNVNGTWKRCI